jgi:hypothetical protein
MRKKLLYLNRFSGQRDCFVLLFFITLSVSLSVLLERLKRVLPLPYHLVFMIKLVSRVPLSWYQSQVVSSSSPGHTFLFRCA